MTTKIRFLGDHAIQALASENAIREAVVDEVDGQFAVGFKLHRGGLVVLCTKRAPHKPRLFKTLNAAADKLRTLGLGGFTVSLQTTTARSQLGLY